VLSRKLVADDCDPCTGHARCPLLPHDRLIDRLAPPNDEFDRLTTELSRTTD